MIYENKFNFLHLLFKVDVIFYEEFIENPLFYTENLLNKLKIPIDEKRKNCLSKNLEGMHIHLGLLIHNVFNPRSWLNT